MKKLTLSVLLLCVIAIINTYSQSTVPVTGMTATASGYYSTYTPNLAVDNSTGTSWTAFGSHYLLITFPATYTLTNITITWASPWGNGTIIELYNGTTVVQTINQINYNYTPPTTNLTQSFTPNSVSVSSIKIISNANPVSISEVSVTRQTTTSNVDYINAINGIFSSKVGISTTSPYSKLSLGSTSDISSRIAVYEVTTGANAGKHFYGIGIANPSTGVFGLGLYGGTQLNLPTNHNMHLFIKNDGKIGIGTTTPDKKIVIKDYLSTALRLECEDYESKWDIENTGDLYFKSGTSTTNTKATFTRDGKVGIGNVTPLFPVHIKGINSNSEKMTLGATNTGVLAITSSDGGTYGLFAGVSYTGNSWLQVGRYDSNTAYALVLQASGGNVLIGKATETNPAYKLDVEGTIRAKEIKVNTDGADFVFAPDYKLRTLAEVEAFIKQNQHLPEITPASDMQTNGVNVSELQTKLLQKVEELTLYLIEMKKENELMKKEIEELKRK